MVPSNIIQKSARLHTDTHMELTQSVELNQNSHRQIKFTEEGVYV